MPRRRAQGRAPLWQQRKRAYDLLSVASRYPSFPILLEAYRECMRDVFDMPALLETLRATGCRPKELCVAEWTEWSVKPDGWGSIVLPPAKWKNGRKTGRVRFIAVPPAQAAGIEWIRAQPGRHLTHIFVHRRGRGRATAEHGPATAGEPWIKDPRKDNTKSLQKWFYRLLGSARKDNVPVPDGFRLYWFRSAFATEARRNGVSDALIAHAMGTSTGQLDRSYSDLDDEDAMKAARAIAFKSAGESPADGDLTSDRT